MTTTEALNVLLSERIDAAVDRVRAALKDQGFGVLTEVDVQATLREKLGTEFYPYRLLGACNPTIAYQALEIDPALGTLADFRELVENRAACGVHARIDEKGAVSGSYNPRIRAT